MCSVAKRSAAARKRLQVVARDRDHLETCQGIAVGRPDAAIAARKLHGTPEDADRASSVERPKKPSVESGSHVVNEPPGVAKCNGRTGSDRQTDRFNPAGAPYGTLRRSPPRYFTRVRLGFSTRAWRLTGVPRLSVGPERLTPHPIRVAPVCRAVLQGLSVLRVVGSTPCVCVREK